MDVGELLAVFGVSRGREVGHFVPRLDLVPAPATSALERPRYTRLCSKGIILRRIGLLSAPKKPPLCDIHPPLETVRH